MKYLLTLCLTLCLLAGCSKDDGPAPINERTLLFYYPYSGNSSALTYYFEKDIEEMKTALKNQRINKARVFVFLMKDGYSGRLFELVSHGNSVQEHDVQTYELLTITSARDISSIFNDVKNAAPALSYAMVIGAHGLSWIPATPQTELQKSGQPLLKMHWESDLHPNQPISRWFGGLHYQTDISTLSNAIASTFGKLEFLLFDSCYMSSIEVAYALRMCTDHLIASAAEVARDGFPYDLIGLNLLTLEPDYPAICEKFYTFYREQYDAAPDYQKNIYGATIAMTKCSELNTLAALMKQINQISNTSQVQCNAIQDLDNYEPTRFFDLGDYVHHYCTNIDLLNAFDAQLAKVTPTNCRFHTPKYFNSEYSIMTFSGLTTSDPSNSSACSDKASTAWWQATH